MRPLLLLLPLLGLGLAPSPGARPANRMSLPQDDQPWPPAPPLELERGDAGPLPPSVQVEPGSGTAWRATFALRSDVRATHVHLAGSFNAWSPNDTPLQRGADGRWRVTLDLPGGVHTYKFVVDGGRWMADPDNDDRVGDGLGGSNSVLRLGPLGHLDEAQAEAGDGQLAAAALEHDPTLPLYRQPMGEHRARLRYRTLEGDLEGVELCLRGAAPRPMRRAARVGRLRYWEVECPLPEAPTEYTFVVRDGEARFSHPEVFTLDSEELPAFRTPDWAKDATWYQILVDRFRNGDREADPAGVNPWTAAWYEPTKAEARSGQTFYDFYVFRRLFGGDLAGVREKLPYLQELGVTAIYFNPVFQADGHHKYNATSFVHVDDAYGGASGDHEQDYAAVEAREDLKDPSTWEWTRADRAFLDLVAECHERGMKVVIDGVFNHVGTRHPAFRDVAEKGRASRFADWFEVESWEPFEPVGWAGFGELPVFAKGPDGFACPEVEQHVFDITRRWMDPDGDGDPSDGIDGWRLDVPMEVPMPFWDRWRRVVKDVNPDAYLTGEVWDRADAWLDGRRFDAVMNYVFASNVLAWIGNEHERLTPTELDERLAELRLAYPAEATYALMNLGGSHDTDRLVSMLQNPDRRFDEENREQQGADYDASKPGPLAHRRARLFALVQAVYVGAPMIYYGDEVAMWGSDDPNNRKPMFWEDLGRYADEGAKVDRDHLAHYRRVFALRRAHRALRRGTLRTLLTDDAQDVWVFLRETEDEQVLVALNASGNEATLRFGEGDLDLGSGWRQVYGKRAGGDATGRQRVPAIDGRVWVRAR